MHYLVAITFVKRITEVDTLLKHQFKTKHTQTYQSLDKNTSWRFWHRKIRYKILMIWLLFIATNQNLRNLTPVSQGFLYQDSSLQICNFDILEIILILKYSETVTIFWKSGQPYKICPSFVNKIIDSAKVDKFQISNILHDDSKTTCMLNILKQIHETPHY